MSQASLAVQVNFVASPIFCAASSRYAIRVLGGTEQKYDGNSGAFAPLHYLPHNFHVVFILGQPSDKRDGIRAYTAALRYRVKRFGPTRAINPFRVHGEHVYPAKLETNVHHRLGLKQIWRHCPQEVAVEIVFAQRHACGAVADLEDFKYLEDAGNLR